MTPFANIKKFMELLHRFHTVDRVAHVPTLTRQTNAVEHSYQLAMLAWYVASSQNLPLNQERVMKYALAHDLVEAYAGDTYIYDEAARATKHEREAAALKQIQQEYVEFPELLQIIEAYEQRLDAESRFVYALDKLIDPLNASMNAERPWWKENNVPYTTLRASKDEKIALSPDVESLWRSLCAELEAKHDTLFPPKENH